MTQDIFNWAMAAIAWVMVVSSLLSKFDGLPKELVDNFKTKTVARIPRRLVLWGFIAYLTLTVHAAFRADWWTVSAQAPGAIFWGIWYWQLRRYPQTKAAVVSPPEIAITQATAYRVEHTVLDSPGGGRSVVLLTPIASEDDCTGMTVRYREGEVLATYEGRFEENGEDVGPQIRFIPFDAPLELRQAYDLDRLIS